MGDDHDRLDAIFVQFREAVGKDQTAAHSFFHQFKIGLQRHIVWEEEVLFPLFESQTGMRDAGPTVVMRAEHREIKAFLEQIHDAIQAGNFNIDEPATGLLAVLTDHNNKEENILYPWIDNSVSEQARLEAFTRMRNLPPEKYNQCCGHA